MKKALFRIIKYIILLLLIIGAFFSLRYFFSTRDVLTYTTPPLPVSTVKAKEGVVEERLTYSGYIESKKLIPVIPFASGTILSSPVDVEDVVKKGETIASIDKSSYELQAKSALVQYEALEESYSRVETLFSKGAATKQDLDTLKAQRDAAKAQYELANLQLSYTDITASEDGTIIKKSASVGTIASSTSPIAIIADTDDLIIRLSISSKYFSIINQNRDMIKVNVSFGDITTTASIATISPYIDATSSTFEVKLSLDDSDGFFIGMYVPVSFIIRSEEGYILPQKIRRTDGSFAYIDNGYAHILSSENIIKEDDSFFLVSPALSSYTFISDGQNQVEEGSLVEVVL